MLYRKLGKTGLPVSVLSFGSWITFGNQISNVTATDLMKLAYEHGVNFFDNAEVYANGRSETVMGEILQNMEWERSSYILSSKVYFGDGGKLPTQRGLHRKHVIEACHAAMKRLKTDYLDLYFCHRPDKTTPIEEVVFTMNRLMDQGKIMYWGTSEWSAQEIMEAHMVAKSNHLEGPSMEQPQYNMFCRDKVELEYDRLYKTTGLGTTIWSPLASGLLTTKYLKAAPEDARLLRDELSWLKEKTLSDAAIDKVSRLNVLANKIGVSLPILAITWCLQNPNVSTVILGASSVQQLQENFTALDNLDIFNADLTAEIEGILQNKPVAPPF